MHINLVHNNVKQSNNTILFSDVHMPAIQEPVQKYLICQLYETASFNLQCKKGFQRWKPDFLGKDHSSFNIVKCRYIITDKYIK